MFKTIGVEPTALENGNVPLDFDVAKTFKEGVSRTFKGNNGFAPLITYIGSEWYTCLIPSSVRESNTAKREHQRFTGYPRHRTPAD